jgi:hypothetical protein
MNIETNKLNEVTQLLEAFRHPKDNAQFTDFTSWLIDDEDYIPIVAQILEETNEKSMRDGCYIMLAELSRNTTNLKCRELLRAGLISEHGVSNLVTILSAIKDFPNLEILDRVCELVNHKNRQVRFGAINALGSFNHPQAESVLLNFIENCSVSNELFIAITSLGNIGTDKSIATLTETMNHRSQDVSSSSIVSISNISKRCHINSTALLIRYLGSTSSDLKKILILDALCLMGDQTALESVKKILFEIFSRDKRQYENWCMLGFESAIDYLLKNDTQGNVEAFFQTIIEKYGNNLQEHERIVLRRKKFLEE